MDALPTAAGWSATEQAGATSRIATDELTRNQSLRVETSGSEVAPGPVASFSLELGTAMAGLFVFDFRLAEVGPYTQVTVAELDFGERALRFHVRNLDAEQERTVLAQLVLADRSQLVWERSIAANATFQTSRLLEVDYDLAAGPRAATILLESTVAEELALGDDWLPGAISLQIGAFGYNHPTSGATFELDNVGFDDRSAQ